MENQSADMNHALDSLSSSFVVAYTKDGTMMISSDYVKGNDSSIYWLASIYHGLKNYDIIKSAAEKLIENMPKEDLGKFLDAMNTLKSCSDPLLCPLDNNALNKGKV